MEGIKANIVNCVARCLQGRQVKAELRHLTRLLQPHAFLESKWEVILREFIVGIFVNDKEAGLDGHES
jgi:hypothetical protein